MWRHSHLKLEKAEDKTQSRKNAFLIQDHSRKNPAMVSFICHYFYISTFLYKTNQIIKHIFLNKKN